MQIDSDIISFSASSLYNESIFWKSSSTRSISETLISSSIDRSGSTTKRDGFWHKFKQELSSFCCVVYFLTCKSMKFHSITVFAILLSLQALFTQMILGGYMSSILSSLQTQYNLSTSKIGYILSSFDIVSVFAVPVVSYIGSRFNKAKVIAGCGFLWVLGGVVFTLPYFLSSKYTVSKTNLISLNEGNSSLSNLSSFDVCKPNISNVTNMYTIPYNTTSSTIVNSQVSCERSLENTWPFNVFIFAQLLMSIGFAPQFSLGITYLCDNLDENMHALYTGIVYGASALGPALGYLMGSFMLSRWVYIDQTAPVSDTDSKWVGLWFPGFMISSCLMLILCILMITFPEKLKKSTLTYKEKRNLRKKKLSAQSVKSVSPGSSVELNTNLIRNNPLPTINESNENLDDDRNDSKLDSISNKIASSSNKVFSIADSVSSNFSSVATHSASSFCYNDNEKTYKENESAQKIIDNLNKVQKNSSTLKDRLNISKLKVIGFFKTFLNLLLNLRYSLLVLIISVECILIASFTSYMILYSQHVYQLSSSTASTLVGGVIVPSAITGALAGGFVVKKFRLGIGGCTRLIMISSLVVLGGIFFLLFVSCNGVPSTGIDLATQSFNKSYVPCNQNCNCQSMYDPTCGIDKITYVSPCYLGCKSVDIDGYYDCSCISGQPINYTTVMATPGECSRNCGTKLIVFLIVLFLVIATEALCLTPATILLLKLIDKPLQPFGLGVMRCANVLLAYIPAPIVISQAIDTTCVLWNEQCQGDKGTCLEYDTSKFHYILFGISAGIKITSCILLIIFSMYIHKTFILKRHFRDKAILNHDITSVLTPKQKYRIDSIVASSDSLRNLNENQNYNRSESVAQNGVILLKKSNSFTDLERSKTPSESSISDSFYRRDLELLNIGITNTSFSLNEYKQKEKTAV